MTDMLDEMDENKLPSGLNTLTILTFIGCGLGFIFGIWGFLGADKRVADMEALLNDPEKYNAMPDFAKKMMSPEALEMARINAANKLPLLLLGLISVGLGLVGALQMRKRKMQGYYLWLIGEVVPVIGTPIFIGLVGFKGWGILGLIFPLVFIILYTIQRKHLTK